MKSADKKNKTKKTVKVRPAAFSQSHKWWRQCEYMWLHQNITMLSCPYLNVHRTCHCWHCRLSLFFIIAALVVFLNIGTLLHHGPFFKILMRRVTWGNKNCQWDWAQYTPGVIVNELSKCRSQHWNWGERERGRQTDRQTDRDRDRERQREWMNEWINFILRG